MKLRALEPEDLFDLYQIENDMEVWQYGNTNAPISRYALRQYISSCRNDIFEDGQIRFAIDHDGVLVGLLDLTNFNPIHRRAEVGIVILPQFRNQGFGLKALNLLIDYAQKIIGLNQIYAIVSEDNSHAQRLFEKSFFINSMLLKAWLISPNGDTHNAILYQFFLSK